MQSMDVMLNTVKDVMHSLGDNTSDFAKRFGPMAFDAAKRVGPAVADASKAIGSSTAQLARRVGPKRGLIGIALLGVAIGTGIYLVRYLRDRRIEESEAGEENLSPPAHGVRPGGSKRKANREPLTH